MSALGIGSSRRTVSRTARSLGNSDSEAYGLNEAGDIVSGQTPKEEAANVRFPGQLSQRLRQRVLTVDLYVSVRPDYEQTRLPHLPYEELQQ